MKFTKKSLKTGLTTVAIAMFALAGGEPVFGTPATASFLGTVTAVGTSVGNAAQVAVDHLGNIWAVSNLNNSVVRWNGAGWTTVISGLSTPYGLAFDSSNNLFVSQAGMPAVIKYPAPNYSAGTQLPPSFNSPVYLAFDANNNLFVADSGNNAIYELLASANYATKTAVVSSGLSGPAGVALDTNGNLFVADAGNGAVKMYTAASSYATETTIATGLNFPEGIVVNRGGDVYVSEVLNGNLDIIPAQYNYGRLWTIYTNTSTFGSRGLAMGAGGVLYEGDYGGGLVYRINTGSVNVGTSAVGTAAAATTVTFVFPDAQTGVHTKVITTGQLAYDFGINNSDPGSCGGTSASNNFSSSQTCTVKVQFSPTSPGLRTGAVELLNGSGTIVGIGYVYGTGTAPLAAFSPATMGALTLNSLSPAVSTPSNPAMRSDGTLFFTDYGSGGRLISVVPGGTPSVVSTGSYSLSNPAGVAIDGAGNVFVSDAGNSRVLEVAAGGTTSELIPASQGMGNMGQVAVDAAGTVYVADGTNARIVVAPPNANVYALPISGITLSSPSGVAVDANFNVYIADMGAIYKVSNGVGTAIDLSSLATPLSNSLSLSFDYTGTLYISDRGGNRIVEVSTTGAVSVMPYKAAIALSGPTGSAFDMQGTMYIADSGNNLIHQLNWTATQNSFASTGVGSLSSDSPVMFKLFNMGNAALNFTVPNSGGNPTISNSAFSIGSSSTCPQLTTSSSVAVLAPQASCNVYFNFQPTATGSAFATVSYTDNSLNANIATSSVVLVGIGVTPTGDATSVTFSSMPSTLYSGQSATLSVTVADTANGSIIPTGTVSFNDSVQGSLGTATINSSGVASLGSVTLTGTGTHQIVATYSGLNGSYLASNQSASIAVSNAPAATINSGATLNFGNVAVGQTSSTQAVTFTFGASGVIGSSAVLSMGASGNGKSFQYLAGGTCDNTSTIWTNGSTCTVQVTFAPHYPGVTMGAVELLDGSGNVIATAFIKGTGTGPLAVTIPGTANALSITGGGTSTHSVAFDGTGNLYFADSNGNQVFKVPQGGGAATLIAGTGVGAYSGDGGAATAAKLHSPGDVAVDGAGNVFIADSGNARIRMVSAATAKITTVAGNGTAGYNGDGSTATAAQLSASGGLALDGAGNLYMGDNSAGVVRKVSAATGLISTVAGNGTPGFSGDGGAATSAALSGPNSIAIDGSGNIYIADSANNRIRRVDSVTGNIATVAGNGNSADSGDGGIATQAGIASPTGVAVDAAGNLTIAEASGTLRVVAAASGLIQTNPVAVGSPMNVREDGAGNTYLADVNGNTLYVVSPTTSLTYPTPTAIGSTDTTDGAKTALVLNIGNTGLTATSLTAPADFAQTTGSGTPADCGANFSLAAGQECALAIQFAPAASGSLTENFVVTDNSVLGATQNIALSGTGLNGQATLTVTGIPLTAQPYGATFTVGATGGSGSGAVTFSASGACSISGTTVTITAGSGTCTVTVMKAGDSTHGAANGTASIAATLAIPSVSAWPTASGITYGQTLASSTLTGGTAAQAGAFAFTTPGTRPAAGNATQPVTFTPADTAHYATVSGSAMVAVSSAVIHVAADNKTMAQNAALPVLTGTLTGVVAGDNITATYATTANSSSAPGTYLITATLNDPNSRLVNYTVANQSGFLTITSAVSPSSLSINAASVVFGSEAISTDSPSQSIFITNTGTVAANVASVNASGDFSTTNNCSSVAPGGSCTIQILFHPTATGTRTGTLTIVDDAGTQTVALSGTSIAAGVTLTPANVTFGSQASGSSSQPESVFITNTSSTLLTITSATAAGDFTVSNTCTTIMPGSNCPVQVTFTPGTTIGVRTGTITLVDSAGAQTISLSGASVAAPLSLSPSALAFRAQTVGTTSATQSITVTNKGTATLTISGLGVSGDFTETNNCGALAAGASCNVAMAFAPTVANARNGILTITDNLGVETVPLFGAADFSVDPNSGTSFSAIVTAGTAATYQPLITALNYMGSVTLSCTGAPDGSSCSVSPTAVEMTGSNAATVSVTVTTTARSSSRSLPGAPGLPKWPWLALAAGLLLAAFRKMMGERRGMWAAPALAALALVTLAGCRHGSSVSSSGGTGGTPAGSYAITVVATAANGVQHSTQLSMKVN